MPLLKNSFGKSISFNPKIADVNFLNKVTGSSLGRKPSKIAAFIDKDSVEELLKKPLRLGWDNCNGKARTLSARSKQKIRKKVFAFSRIHKKLTFVTLTFVNLVDDREAIKILGAFLDNVSKQNKDFQYIWVVENQTKNKEFKNNVHFHIITNLYWDIKRWWQYWLDVQKKHGVIPRDSNFKPSSALDVKFINANNIKSIGNYITKYITKNESSFHGALWNCSKKVSQLYTDFYSDMKFMEQLERLQEKGLLKGKIVSFEQEYCKVYLVPLNNLTTHFYDVIDKVNKTVWAKDVSKN